ncbi:hypothetical protein [Nocardioides marmotae]|uniref:Uncharacterized protein n=1 Tax=Nocardioides marmotae TaxID=2663857 RepID=A0A6I3JEU5_9ACTN|nr:hypothetical protein [Nocardioides marmotae]MCR6033082.1 hypothetical protein [Gordonia jinghuaiqii]MBC9732582.1 hypothetical protein [Nocardioides marmotae]MTB83701.1 hypothetical protein [Nocardioides marmotae]MTB96734.1 hypothetical protein [Nocardioides marmotae]QKE03056.1 hypothetical protein HPC71_19825 [Nocardioides marmotae]
MSRRRPGGTVLAAVVACAAVLGVAGGAVLAGALEEEPRTVASAVPLPAVSPSYPVDPPLPVKADPDTPGLKTGVRLQRAQVGIPPFGLRLPVPAGWRRSDSLLGEWKWFPPGQPDKNAYFLRVRLVTGFQTREAALRERLSALSGASDVQELVIETQDEDGFTATYVTDDHRRVAMERFLSFDGRTAYATVAVVGRERDLLGMADLVERIVRRAATS